MRDQLASRGVFAGPLHGIPIGVKDLFETADMPTAAGSRVLAGNRPAHDAEAVRRLRAAGAVVVGKTVTHEFSYGLNEPPTRNAWDPTRYPGGSSAGSAVAVAVGSAAGSIGTDTAGSVRTPAAVNGVVGLKPTYGTVSTRGVIPSCPSLDHVGPLARRVYDCALLYSVLSEARPFDPRMFDAGADRPLTNVRLGVDRDYFFTLRTRRSRVRSIVPLPSCRNSARRLSISPFPSSSMRRPSSGPIVWWRPPLAREVAPGPRPGISPRDSSDARAARTARPGVRIPRRRSRPGRFCAALSGMPSKGTG